MRSGMSRTSVWASWIDWDRVLSRSASPGKCGPGDRRRRERPDTGLAATMLSPKNIVRACLTGKLGAEELTNIAHDRWNRGEFVEYIDPEDLMAVKPMGQSTQRYAGASSVEHWRIYGEPGVAGCILVRSPHDEAYRNDLSDLQVPPHVHSTDHIAIVLEGGGSFVAARSTGGVLQSVVADARPGMIAYYPSGVPHTFISGTNGILVATLQSEYQHPGKPEFATPVPGGLLGIERLDYDEWRSASAAASPRA